MENVAMIGINIIMNNDIIFNEYMQGASAAVITKKYKIQYNNIKKIVTNKGGLMRSHSQANRRYNFNHNFFEKIDNEQKAYYLGFILTDGYVGDRDIVLELKSVDKHIIESFVTAIEGNNKIHEIVRDGNSFSKKGCITSRLNFRSEKMVSDLKNLGIQRGKTYKITIPDVPSHLKRHFWRGVLDGDGWVCCLKRIYKYTTSKGQKKTSMHKMLETGICGHINTITSFISFLKDNNITYRDVYPDHTIFGVRLKNATEATKFLNLIYKDADSRFWLKRKYAKYLEFLDYKKNTKRIDKSFIPLL